MFFKGGTIIRGDIFDKEMAKRIQILEASDAKSWNEVVTVDFDRPSYPIYHQDCKYRLIMSLLVELICYNSLSF